ncbi:MAG: 1-acyl-sn-glycerol-3-phosphate acyltransferase [Oscillospiraceae bacterium]|jgi:1-acyl-sn-glycerol-3-phosphate acyltransferase|nr:1-acyl-sn-glycerol-3-phosphate acyltransferase [Oscillospiraceae bacterium]
MFYRFAYGIVIPLFRLLFRVRIVGRDNIPPGAAVVCANHAASSDPIFVAMGLSIRQHPYFMAKIELVRNPVFAFVLRRLGVFFVDRGKSDIRPIKHALTLLREDKKIMIFPEGTRAQAEAKTGAAMLAVRSNVPLLPVSVTPSGHKRLFSRVNIVIGEPYRASVEGRRASPECYHKIMDELMRRIYALDTCHA